MKAEPDGRVALVIVSVSGHQRLEDPRPRVFQGQEHALVVRPQLDGPARVRPVEVRGVDVGRVLVQLLAGTHPVLAGNRPELGGRGGKNGWIKRAGVDEMDGILKGQRLVEWVKKDARIDVIAGI